VPQKKGKKRGDPPSKVRGGCTECKREGGVVLSQKGGRSMGRGKQRKEGSRSKGEELAVLEWEKLTKGKLLGPAANFWGTF